MNPEIFIAQYETALASQDWAAIAPLILPEACVIFSSGEVLKGINAIKTAYERNFSIIKNEKYAMSDVEWIKKEADVAIYFFNFRWAGIIDGKEVQGAGLGTATIVQQNGNWKLLLEHLGPKKQ